MQENLLAGNPRRKHNEISQKAWNYLIGIKYAYY